MYKEKSVPKSRRKPISNKVDSNGLYGGFGNEVQDTMVVLNNINNKLPYI